MSNFQRVAISPSIILEAISQELQKSKEVNLFELPHIINGSELSVVGEGLFSNIRINHLHVPSNIKVIRDSAFNNSHIEQLTFEEGIEYIDSGAFEENKLTSLILPKSLLFIGKGCFNKNPIDTIVISENVTYIDRGAFNSIHGIKEVKCIENSIAHNFFRDKYNCILISKEQMNSFYYRN